MVTVLLTGHGNFATGMLSASRLIVGPHPQLFAVDFVEGESTDDLRAKIRAVFESAPGDVLVMTDIAGGSPYNISVTLKTELASREIEVVSGANIPMLISAVLERGEYSAAEVADSVIETSLKAIKRFKRAKIVQQDAEVGI